MALNPSNMLARFRLGVIDTYHGRYEDALTMFKSTPLQKLRARWESAQKNF